MQPSEAAYREELKQKGRLVLVPKGQSMYPALRSQTDTVVLIPPKGRLSRLSIALYVREDGVLVLHRVIKVGELSYTLCGDRLRDKEYGIAQSQIIGVMEAYYRGQRLIRADSLIFRLSSAIWYLLPRCVTKAMIRLWVRHK